MRQLNSRDRAIMLQFSFSNIEVIPALVKRANPETHVERAERKSEANINGIKLIDPVKNVSLVTFLEDLAEAGYVLVSSFYQERLDSKDFFGKEKYHTVRYFFVRREFDWPSEEFKAKRGDILAELMEMVRTSNWRVRAYDNPFYENGEPNGERTISVNLEVREPLFRPDGSQIVARPKDANGRIISQIPVPICADHDLRILDDEIVVI